MLSDGDVHGEETYGDWMVVLHKKRHNKKHAQNPNVTRGATARAGGLNTQCSSRRVF